MPLAGRWLRLGEADEPRVPVLVLVPDIFLFSALEVMTENESCSFIHFR